MNKNKEAERYIAFLLKKSNGILKNRKWHTKSSKDCTHFTTALKCMQGTNGKIGIVGVMKYENRQI